MDWPTILAFTKVGAEALGSVAWPAAAAGIAFCFRKPIGGVIDRANKVSLWGVEAEIPIAGQPISGDPRMVSGPDASGRILTVTPNPQPDPLLMPSEDRLRQALDEQALTIEQKLAWAIRLGAMFQMLARHEQHYRWIFGSQIAFLKHINQVGPMTKAEVRSFWDEHAMKPPPSPNYTFENWLGFLTAEDLTIEGSGDSAVVAIAPVGRAFLNWMVSQAAVEQKPL